MPRLYKPPVARQTQAIRRSRRMSWGRLPPPWRRLWLVPLLGLLPVLVAVVLASEGHFGGAAGGAPVASGPAAPTGATDGAAQVDQTGNERWRPGGGCATGNGRTGGGGCFFLSAEFGGEHGCGPRRRGRRRRPGSASTPGSAGTAGATSAVGSNAPRWARLPPRRRVRPGRRGLRRLHGLFRAYRVQPGDTVRLSRRCTASRQPAWPRPAACRTPTSCASARCSPFRSSPAGCTGCSRAKRSTRSRRARACPRTLIAVGEQADDRLGRRRAT